MFFYFGKIWKPQKKTVKVFFYIYIFLMRFDCSKKINLNVNVNLLSYSQ